MPALETPEILRLRCVIQGEPFVFTLDVSAQTEIGQLKRLIQLDRAEGILKDVDYACLILWKPRDLNAITVDPEETLPQRIESFGDCLSSFADRMSSIQSLLAFFPNQPSLTHINIIVETPTSGEWSDESCRLLSKVVGATEMNNDMILPSFQYMNLHT